MAVEDHHHGERFGTAAEWSAANPTLRAGEWGVETDTSKAKVGDGVTQWASLGYASVTDHGALTGLGDDDHSHYLNTARHDTTARHGSAVVDHGSIGGLGDDDHTQYLLKAGGTMTGDLTLAADPDADLKAATKQYVDNTAGGGSLERISRTVLASDTATVVLDSIPATYDHLVLKGRLRASAATYRTLRALLNGSTSGVYNYQWIRGTDTTVSGDSNTGQANFPLSAESAAVPPESEADDAAFELRLYHYADTDRHTKLDWSFSGKVSTGAGGNVLVLGGGTWRAVTAISRIDILLSGDSIESGAIFTLYGLKQ